MLKLHVLIFLGHFLFCYGCSPYDTIWNHWGPCSHSCGGGTRRRTGHSCVWHTHKSGNGKCNEFCYNGGRYSGGCSCSAWRTGRCCGSCRHIYIANCKSGHQQCGGSPDNIKCTVCDEPYYSAGYGQGCHECPAIAHCEHRHCSTPSNVKCVRCYDDKVFFIRTQSDTKCERVCAWNGHYCWPGECADTLTSSCKCADGFHAVKSDSETSCQLIKTNAPAIETCETIMMGPYGERKRAKSNSSSTACTYLMDFYGNFQPKYLISRLLVAFEVDTSSVKKPAYIHEYNFGVTDTKLTLLHRSIRGVESIMKQHHIRVDNGNGTHATRTMSASVNMSIVEIQTLTDGEWLCIDYEAKAGGFLKSVDLLSESRETSPPVPYTKTTTTRRLCYKYDSSKPEHCGVSANCSLEPIQIPERITRSSHMHVQVQGWFDPVPDGGFVDHTSGIESYEITLQEIIVSKYYLQVDTKPVTSALIQNSSGIIYLNLTSNTPKLYAIYLEVKDTADNVRESRRFVLYDNSSYIETNPNRKFYIDSASRIAKYEWQTHHNDLCVNWSNYFFNRFYLTNPLLNKIELDPSGLIKGYYDQISGVLPTEGTPNVNGIINFKFSWAINNETFSHEQNVPNFQRQRYCQRFDMSDGDTYTFRLSGLDIANNLCMESTSVHIDQSLPNINHVGLVNDQDNDSIIYNSTDLSQMIFSVEAMDPHSGIKMIEWSFGLNDTGTILATSNIFVGDSDIRCTTNCYCPSVGRCVTSKHTIRMTKLLSLGKHIGENNYTYTFTVKVTNHAMLSKQESIDILVFGEEWENGSESLLVPVVSGSVASLAVVIITGLLAAFAYRRWKHGADSELNSQVGHDGSQHIYMNAGKSRQLTSVAEPSDTHQYETLQDIRGEQVHDGIRRNGKANTDQAFENVSYQISPEESVKIICGRDSSNQAQSQMYDNMEPVYENMKLSK